MVFLFIEHEGGDGPTGIGVVAGLTTDSNSGVPNAELVLGARDGTRRGRH